MTGEGHRGVSELAEDGRLHPITGFFGGLEPRAADGASDSAR